MVDAYYRNSKVSKIIEALKLVWNAKKVPLHSKIKLYEAVLNNLVLLGSQN